MKIVIETGAEVTLKAGGSFVKVDSSGVTVFGPVVRMNSGGGPGSGSAVAAKAPETPALITAGETTLGSPDMLAVTETRQAATPQPGLVFKLCEAALASKQCGKQPDGHCYSKPCSCEADA